MDPAKCEQRNDESSERIFLAYRDVLLAGQPKHVPASITRSASISAALCVSIRQHGVNLLENR